MVAFLTHRPRLPLQTLLLTCLRIYLLGDITGVVHPFWGSEKAEREHLLNLCNQPS